MLQQFALRLSNLLQEKKIVKEEDREIYAYGLEALLSTILNTLVVLAAGILSGLLLETVIYLVSFAALRVYSGGYHAKTHRGCILTFLTLYTLSMATIVFCPKQIMEVLSLAAGSLTFILVWLVAPIQHPNRPLSVKESNQFRVIARIVAGLEAILLMAFLFLIPGCIQLSPAISMAMLSVSFILAIAKIIEGKR